LVSRLIGIRAIKAATKKVAKRVLNG